MNPIVSALVGSAVRWLVTMAAAHGVALADDQATQIVSGLVALGMLGWSAYQKKNSDKAVKTAAATGTDPR